MRKKTNIIIIFISTIMFIVLYALGVRNPFVLTILTIPFYFMNLLFYNESRLFIGFNIATIVSLFGYFFFINIMVDPPLNLIFLAMTDVGKYITFFLMFGIVLQNKIDKKVERIFIYLNLFNIIFLSLTRINASVFIVNFVSYARDVRESTFIIFEIIFLVLYFLNAFVKSYVITILDKRKEIRINKEIKRQEKIRNQFY